MKNLLAGKSKWASNWLVVLAASLVCGLGGLGIAAYASANPLFLVAVPAGFMALLFTLVNLQGMIAVLLLVRALLDPMLNLTKVGGGFGIGGLINLFVVFLGVLFFLGRPRTVTEKNKFAGAWMLFIAAAALSVVYSPVASKSVKLVMNFMSYVAMFLMPFYLVRSQEDRRYWIKVLLAASVLPLLIADIGMVTHYPKLMFLTKDAGIRLTGTFTHPNILAFYLVFVVALVFYSLKSPLFTWKPAMRRLLFLHLVNALVLLIVTKTRSAWVSCWMLFAIYGFLKERKYLVICLLAPVVLMATPIAGDRIREITEGRPGVSSRRLNSMEWRVALWKSSFSWIVKSPVIGYGLGSFEYYSVQFFALEKKRGVPAHNTYLELLFETGVIGLLTYLLIYLRILARFRQRMKAAVGAASREYAILIAYTLGYLAVAYSDNTLYYLAFNWYLWFFLGIAIRSTELEDEKNLSHHPVV